MQNIIFKNDKFVTLYAKIIKFINQFKSFTSIFATQNRNKITRIIFKITIILQLLSLQKFFINIKQKI